MISYRAPLPADDYPTAFDALRQIVDGATSLRVAVAFVTSSGVELVEQLRAGQPELMIEVIARGAPITDPAALVVMADQGVGVAVVVGSRAAQFHPKIWLAERPDGLYVLAGSGNLTGGGLRDNVEQFELLYVDPSDIAAKEAQHERFTRLTRDAVPLAAVRNSPYWNLWRRQLSRRRELAALERELDETLLRAADADRAVEALYVDLVNLYERAKAEVRIPARDGGTRRYIASYFKRAIDDSRGRAGPVPVVARMVKTPTQGFDHLANARRPDLMVEALVLDPTKTYHRLFDRTTVSYAQANMDAYASRLG